MSSPKAPQRSRESKELEQRQLAELRRLETIETRKRNQLARSRTGRRSLISGSELGIVPGMPLVS